MRKQFDPWHFGAITIPPELIKEYDEAMQRYEAGELPGPNAEALEAGAKVQAYKEGWGKPLSRQFSEDAARLAVTQASMVRVRQARVRQLAFGALAVLSFAVCALVYSQLGKGEGDEPSELGAQASPPVEPTPVEPAPVEPTPVDPPPPPPPAAETPEAPARNSEPATGAAAEPKGSAETNSVREVTSPTSREPRLRDPAPQRAPLLPPETAARKADGRDTKPLHDPPAAASVTPPKVDLKTPF